MRANATRPASSRRRPPTGDRPPHRFDERGVRRGSRRIAGYAPDDLTTPGNPYGRRSSPARRRRRRTIAGTGRPRHRADGLALRPARARLPHKILARRGAPRRGEPLRVVGDEWGTPTYAADVADAIVELLGRGRDRRAPITSSTAGSRHAPTWARDVFRGSASDVEIEEVPASTWERASDAASVGRPRSRPRSRAGNRCVPGRRRWPTTPPLLRRRDAGGRPMTGLDRPPRRSASRSATARSPGSATSAARSASSGGGPVRADRPAQAGAAAGRAALRAGQPVGLGAGVLRGLHFHRRQLDHWIVASGRAFVALVDVRPMLADPAAPVVETRELRPTTGSTSRPASPTGSSPSSRSSSSTS